MNSKIYKTFFAEGMGEFISQNYDKSIELLSEFLKSEPNHKIALISRGSAFLKLNQIDDAAKDLNRVIDLYPEYHRAYHLRGLVNEKNGENKAALADFNHAIELDPDYGAAYYSRATLHTKMGNEDLATEDVQMVTHLTNRNIEEFANENNVWRSQHLRLENMVESDLGR